MDGANFRGEWNGVFTTLSFKDANNKIVHVATVVSAKEDGASYRYLLTKAMESPLLHGVLNNAKTTCFTDNHKGSNSALPRICPLTEDRRCVEHLLKAIGKVGVVSLTKQKCRLSSPRGKRMRVPACIVQGDAGVSILA